MGYYFSESFFSYADFIQEALWGYLCIPILVFMGIYFTIRSRFFQLVNLPSIIKIIINMARKPEKQPARGIPPLYAFFASIGGCLGIGNVVGVASAVQIGGPGAILWMWVFAFFGMLVKYSEVYLTIRFRVENEHNSYDGGPMIYLQKAFNSKLPAYIFCFLLCIYGVEVYMFRVVSNSISIYWHLNYPCIVALLLFLVFYTGRNGVSFIGRVSSIMIPSFLMIYSALSMWVFVKNYQLIPTIFFEIVHSAFNGRAAVGAFAGSTMARAIIQGASRACYTGDIGVGYAGVIHSETGVKRPEHQAVLEIFGIFLDSFVVCTMSVMLLLITGLWNAGVPDNLVVAMALLPYFPHIDLIWPLVIFLLGFSALVAFFVVGRKAANFISPKYGSRIYDIYAVIAYLFFAFFGTENQTLTFMGIIGGCLLTCNLIGMWRLRKEIKFVLPDQKN